jgi:ribosome production factor 1
MGKKGPVSKSLQGKKPINSAKKIVTKQKSSSKNASLLSSNEIYVPNNPGRIGNKLKRSEMYGKYLQQKSLLKQAKRREQKEEDENNNNNNVDGDGDDDTMKLSVKNVPKTLDSTREIEITMVDPNDEEIIGDEADDEFAPYFQTSNINHDDDDDDDDVDDDDPNLNRTDTNVIVPKILITTRPHPSKKLFYFIADMQLLLPNVHYYPRKLYSTSQITTYAYNRNFTHLIIVYEKNKVCNGMLISHLGYRPSLSSTTTTHQNDNDGSTSTPSTPMQPLVGPTAFFKVSNVMTGSNIPHHGCRTSHRSELNLHNFQTRLGQRIGRLFASLFPIQQGPEFIGRQIVTFHNQRDYIFIRHHRYIFNPTANGNMKDETKQSTSDSTTTSKKSKKVKKEVQLDTTTKPTQVSEMAAKIPVKTKLQELGPRFTLKLRWLQDGVGIENTTGIYEFIHKRKEMDTSRRKFHL